MPDQSFWKQKLMAFLHDPPCKPLKIAEHEQIARDFRSAAGIAPEEYQAFERSCDHTASAADRFPFPGSAASGCSARYAGDTATPFRHPLGGADLAIGVPRTLELAIGEFQDTSGSTGFSVEGLDPTDEWRIRQFLYWRRWPEESAKHDRRLAYLPADTRMPDHTIWNHMSLTSAFQGCVDDSGKLAPAFLLWQLGPVQEFIAAARSTRDLWSGSYLLSWLTAHAIKAVTDRCGPDAVIFPSLRGLGVFDAVCREDVFDHVRYKEEPLWDRLYGCKHGATRLLIPSLPNRFLALVPEADAATIAASAEEAVHHELTAIYEACRGTLEPAVREYQKTDEGRSDSSQPEDWFERWQRQLRLFPQITWQLLPWESDPKSVVEKYGRLPMNQSAAEQDEKQPAEALQALRDLACDQIPVAHRDDRFYRPGTQKSELNNPGMAWSAFYSLADHTLAARRNTRDFAQWTTDEHQHGSVKDSLTGVEECIGSEGFWKFLTRHSTWGETFKPDTHRLGGISLLKRLWCHRDTGYLPAKLALPKAHFREALGFDSVAEVADAGPESEMRKKEGAKPGDDHKYVAVIALDGDEMGKWVSGRKTPSFGKLLADEVRRYFDREVPGSEEAMDVRRPLSPSFHLQFSEALANFAAELVPRVLEPFRAQLVYSGGDDVMFMVSADRALECAYALRCMFQGEDRKGLIMGNADSCAYFEDSWPTDIDLTEQPAGWVTITGKNPDMERKRQTVYMVPGPQADVSCGIAIAHYQHPLQHIVNEARHAEKRAKCRPDQGGYGRGSFAASLLKRGGETIHWGGRWDGEALPLFFHYRSLRRSEPPALSARFPYALATLLRPYNFGGLLGDLREAPDFNPKETVRRELMHVIERQSLNMKKGGAEALCKMSMAYLDELLARRDNGCRGALDDFEKLFLAAAFIDRRNGGEPS